MTKDEIKLHKKNHGRICGIIIGGKIDTGRKEQRQNSRIKLNFYRDWAMDNCTSLSHKSEARVPVADVYWKLTRQTSTQYTGRTLLHIKGQITINSKYNTKMYILLLPAYELRIWFIS